MEDALIQAKSSQTHISQNDPQTPEVKPSDSTIHSVGPPPLVFLNPKDVAKLADSFVRDHHPYFPDDNRIKLPFKEFLPVPDPTVALFRWSYPGFCFEKSVLERCGFAAGRPVIEAGSGNNDISRYDASKVSFPDPAKDRYYISNYSGGRGDYFSLQALARILNSRAERLGVSRRLEVEHLCFTLGGQGGLHASARFFARTFPGKKLAVIDSSYVGTIAPFVSEGVPIAPIAAGENGEMPTVDSVLSTVRQPDVCGFMYVPYHNPSGLVWGEADLHRICAELVKTNKYLICSEVFDGLDWSGDVSQSELLDKACDTTGLQTYARVFSVSKSRGLAGLRAGYMVGSKDVTWHASQVNALSSFNTPVTNSRVLVLHEYLTELMRGGANDKTIETFLRLDELQGTSLMHALRLERSETRSIVRNNFTRLLSTMGIAPASVGQLATGKDASIVMPAGGINCLVRLNCLAGIDQIDLFRKIYLWSGLILHTSKYLHKAPGHWLRVTLAHDPLRLQQVFDVLKALPQAVVSLQVQETKTTLDLV